MTDKIAFVYKSRLVIRLIGAFLLVIVIGALIIYFLTSQATQNAFRIYTTQNSQLWAERLAPEFANYYAQVNTWQGVDRFIQADLPPSGMAGMQGGMGRGQGHGSGSAGMGWMGGMGQRLILADAQGMVIADSEQALLGSQLSAEELSSGSPIIVRNQVVGTLIVAPTNLHSVTDPGGVFLASVNRSILISVLAAGVISLVLALLFSIQITAPVRQMQKAAWAIANGDLNQRVPVRSQDELGSLAETFNQMARSLATAEEQRRKLLTDIAHELRTPLAVIQANTEGMQDGVLPLDLEQIDAIHAETLLLGRLIDDLRLISVAEAGELRLERQVVELLPLLNSAVERFQPHAAQKGVVLSLDIDRNLPRVAVDADRITQVLNNLLSNALRYTPERGTISIEASETAGNASEVQISVTDTGPGIPTDDLPWVFERFYRADKSRARVSGGTGLGLAIVKKLVEAHGGRVWAQSPIFGEPSHAHGTRITFTLPAALP